MDFETTLRRLSRNDTDIIVVDSSELPHGHGWALGEALLHNTKVEHLLLDLDHILRADDEHTLASAHIKDTDPLLRFLSTSKSLVQLTVADSSDQEFASHSARMLAYLLLGAIAESGCLERVNWEVPVHPWALRRLISNAHSLRELNVAFPEASMYSQNDQHIVASAFGLSKTLQSVTLAVRLNEDLAMMILSNLQQVHSLRELYLIGDESFFLETYFEAMVEYLHSTAALRELAMDNFSLDNSIMRSLLWGLQQSGGSTGRPTTFISTLKFFECIIHPLGGQRLASFLQTKTHDSNGEMIYVSYLRELYIHASDERHMGDLLSKQLADSLLMATQVSDTVASLVPTIGSQIHTLSLMPVRSLFLDILSSNANKVQLQKLMLAGLSTAACQAFFRSIPNLVSLRELQVVGVAPQGLDWILRGLKGNGSIHHVKTTSSDESPSDFSARQLRLIDAYCQRNIYLENLIDPQVGLDEEDGAGTVKSGSALFPSLLQAAKCTRTTMFLRGLFLLNGPEA